LDPVQRFLLGVSEMSKDDDDLEDTERPTEQPATRKRRSRDRSYKLMTAFRPVRSRR
jgi:hypothetical protein